ncbi:MAG TPA: L-histidine N(alpha)-methyltransferase [Rhodocyclaceae bacterium]|nr:L-histidine N(alpha)-methyltransferase [Rhodocyclaceae bacterium]
MTTQPHLDSRAAFAWAALDGLARPQKSIPCTWLYDRRGSELFERITTLDEYYPTRNEIALLHRYTPEVAQAVGATAVVIEIGSGSSRKTPLLLRQLEAPRAYVPIDIAPHCLEASITMLKAEFPRLPMYPLVADFNQPLRLPPELRPPACRHLAFFPGSTIGNLDSTEARDFLARLAGSLGPEAWMLVGVDTTRDPAALLPAYDDPGGVTAAFNLNLLARLNRELGGDFDLAAFRHEARYNPLHGRVEMHLVSERSQRVRLLGKTFRFAAGESLHTENSHKYPVADFQALAKSAGWHPVQCWTDGDDRFSIHLLGRP